jgi:hypothetical protein
VETLRGTPAPATITLPDLPASARSNLSATLSGRVYVVCGQVDDAHPFIPAKIAYGAFFTVKK